MREADFQQAISSVHLPVPHRRFAIYRNNVASGLVTALAVRFPVTQQLVGEDFFRAMAALYAEGNKPASAVLIDYGESLVEFVANFEPAKAVPYLADVAKLENLWWRAYHAGDGAFAEAKVLGDFPQDALEELRFNLHPSVGVMTSPFAISKIWRAHHGGDAMGTFELETADYVLVSRPAADVQIKPISMGFATFIGAFLGGVALAEGVALAVERDDAFDLSAALSDLFQLKLVSGVFHD